jgi:hypothetical protein
MARLSPFNPLPTEDNGAGHPRRYRKEIARVGDYEHPDGPLSFDAERLRRWRDAFDEAAATGVRIPVPLGHQTEPTANAGWVADLELSPEGDRLYAVLEITRPEVAELIDNGSIRYTSLALGPLADDGGRFWEEALLEVSLVTEPHVRKQEPFVTLAGDRRLAVELAALRGENRRLLSALETVRDDELERRLDDLVADGELPPGERDRVHRLAAALPTDEDRRLLLESYRRRGVRLGAATRPAPGGNVDDELAAVARRFDLKPGELAYYLDNPARRDSPQATLQD